MSKLPYIIGLLTVLILGIHTSTPSNSRQTNSALHQSGTADKIVEKYTASTENSPSSINIALTFYSQAPLGNWDLPFAEACEEASALLVANAYFHHNWTAGEFNQEILNLVEWEKQHFNKYIDTSSEETAQILDQYLHLQTLSHENPSLADIKKILANGHLIIGFFAGRELGNPNYRNAGPLYHALIIKGYTADDQIVTDDVGTAQGENYQYSWDTIHNALHDLADPIENGPKKILEVWPPD